MDFVDAFLAELRRPSTLPPGPLHGAYERAVIGIGHMAVGGALASLLPVDWAAWGAGARLALVGVYWWTKERGDLRRGGTVADGVEDAACVGLGCWMFPPVAAWSALAVGLYLMWRGYVSRDR